MGEGAWLVAFLIVQRLAELGFAQWNTVRLRAEGGVEFGAAHYPLMVALHASWLLGLWMLGHDRSVDPFWLTVFILLQAGRLVGDRYAGPALDHAGDRAALRCAGCARALPLAAASKLPGRRCRDHGGSAGAWVAAVCAGLFARQCGAARHPHSRREPGAGLGPNRAG